MKAKHEFTREEIERIISICENIERRGLDPFTVNVKELLVKLRRILEENPNLDYYIIDAETLYRIAALIAFQHKWLTEKAKALFIDSQLISARLTALDKKSIAQAFLKAWRPIVSLEQLTSQRLQQGMEHFLKLPPRREGRGYGWKLTEKEMELAKIAAEREKEEMERKVKTLYRELLERAGERGEADYWDFISAPTLKETFERAYVLSFLITEGYAEVRRNPIREEIRVKPNPEKRLRKSPTSLVISIEVRKK